MEKVSKNTITQDETLLEYIKSNINCLEKLKIDDEG